MLPGQRQRPTTGFGIHLLEKTGKVTIVYKHVRGAQGEERHAQPEEKRSQIASWQGSKIKPSMGTGNPLSTS